MRNTHLRIHYGADDRFDVVSKTIISSYKYFKTIRLVNLGPEENSEKFIPFIKKIPHFSISNFGKHYFMCESEDTLRSHFMDVPDGDWVAWLDSDWRIPESSLKIMSNEIDICEREGFNHIFSYQIPHHIGEGNIPHEYCIRSSNYTQPQLNRAFEVMREKPERYGWPIIQKCDKKNIFCESQLGNHPHLLHVPYKYKRIPEFYHLHFRDYTSNAYCGSSTYLCWWYLGHHVFSIEEQVEIQKSDEYKRLEEFKHKHHCYTSTQLHQRVKNNDWSFLLELKELFLSFSESKIFSCKQMYQLAKDANMRFYSAPPEPRCNGICCEYEGKNIYDLADEFIKEL